MKRMFSVFLLITVWLLVTPFLQAQSHVDKVLKDEITSDLKENILSFWERYSVDSSGGFYGSLGRDGAPIADAPKGGVLNARILWTFSTAFSSLDHFTLSIFDRRAELFQSCIRCSSWITDRDRPRILDCKTEHIRKFPLVFRRHHRHIWDCR